MRSVGIFSAVLFLLVPSLAVAAPQCKANGCGPDGYIGHLVPDRFFHLCEFKECCDSHDLCYSRCLDCGDLHGKPQCEDKTKRTARKAVCDQALYDDINRVNANRFVCKGFAFAYKAAVRLAGDPLFHGMVMSAEAEAKFRSDFNAALAYYEFETAQGRSFEIDQTDSAIQLLSRLDGIENNALTFRTTDNHGVLALESQRIQNSPRLELRGDRAVEQQRFLNNIDVTKMEYAGQRFDLDRAIRDAPEPGVDIRTLQQREQYVPIQ